MMDCPALRFTRAVLKAEMGGALHALALQTRVPE
jgi:hypothetical protein